MDSTYFYKDKPLFGLDIGHSSIKVMQAQLHEKKIRVLGYGIGAFDSSYIKNGEIVEPEKLAEQVNNLFKNNLNGSITTRRVAVNIPASKAFSRSMQLPVVADNELTEAVNNEASQYIPLPIEELYLDYSVIKKNEKGTEVLAVGAPRKIVDSYMNLMLMLGLEPIVFDTSIGAAGRLFSQQEEHGDIPAVLIDFGSTSADITVYDKTSLVTGTIALGGDKITEIIKKALGVTREEAHIIKIKYGVSKSKKQKEILAAIKPEIDQLVREIKRVIRYYEERSGSTKKIGQILTMGGGANTPGLNDHLTDVLRIPVRMNDPWPNIDLHKLPPPGASEKSMYVTVAGLSIIKPEEIFA